MTRDRATGETATRDRATGETATRDRATGEAGSAVVEFTMVLALLIVVFLGVIEIALLLHVRDVVTADAAEGARYEANAGASQGSGAGRAEALLSSTLASGTSRALTCASTRAAGVVAVTCRGHISLPFLPIGVDLSQTAHALLEPTP